MPQRILVVDDEPGIVGFCERLLARLGFEARAAASGEAALPLLESEPFDLLLADVVMPGMSGLDLLVEARRRLPGIAAVIMTGHGSIELAVRALRAGAHDFIVKPFSGTDLAEAVEHALSQVRATQENLRLVRRLEARCRELEQGPEAHAAEREATQERLIRQERLAIIGRLGASVAHELRNPLGVIGNSAYYLATRLSGADAGVARHLDIIRREVATASDTITALMSFVQAREARVIPSDPNAVVLATLARAVVPDAVAVRLDLARDLPLVTLDPERMQQVFLNLISNAAQAMPQGGQLTVSTHLEDGRVRFSFADTGVGIAPDDQAHIFEPLYTTKAKGFGLGLALVQLLVDAHDGEITVSSRPGAGVCFSVLLPIAQSPSSEP